MPHLEPENQEQFLTLAEASSLTGYHQDYLGQLCRSGKLAGKKIGRNWVTTKKAVEEFTATQVENGAYKSQDAASRLQKLEIKQPSLLEASQPAAVADLLPAAQVASVIGQVNQEPKEVPQATTTVQVFSVPQSMKPETAPQGPEKLSTIAHRVALPIPEPDPEPEPPKLKHLLVSNFELAKSEAAKISAVSPKLDISKLEKSFAKPLIWNKSAVVAAAMSAFLVVSAMWLAANSGVVKKLVGGENKTTTIVYRNDTQLSLAEDFGNSDAEVLGVSTRLSKPSSSPSTVAFNETYLRQLILNSLNSFADKFRGPQGPAGPAGPAGQNGNAAPFNLPANPTPLAIYPAPVAYVPPVNNNNPVTLLSATSLSSQNFVTTNATITNLTLASGGNFNPGFTTGSVVFQGGGGLSQDNSNFYWDDSNNALGVGTSAPAATAILDLTSTSKGFLAPRMSTSDRNAIVAPATGLLIYNTSSNQFNVYDGGSWTSITGGGGGSSVWSDLTNPSANLALAMGANTTTFTYGATTGAGTNLFTLTDTANNTGTGYLFNLSTASTSALKPFRVAVNNGTNALTIDATGLVVANNFASSGAVITGGSINSTPIGQSTPAAGSFTTLTSNTSQTFSNFTSNGGPLYTNGSGTLAQVTAGTSSQVLHGGATPSFSQIVNGDITNGTIDLTTKVTGNLPATNGGTGFASYAVGDLLYANTTTSLAKLADVATGNVLISGGVSTAPTWGKVTLGTHTTGNYVSDLTGTANQITVSAATGSVTLSTPSDFRAPGTLNATTSIATGAGAGTVRIDASGNLTNIGTITSGLINGQTISSAANFTGTIAFATLGSTDSTSILCRNTSNQIAACNALTDSQISDTLTSSLFVGSGSTTTAIDLATAEVAGVLPIANGGTNAATSQGAINNISQLTTNGDILYHDGANSTRLPRGANGECLKSNATTLVWGGCTATADSISVNGSAATDGNFIDTAASGTVASVAWTLNTTPSPDEISIVIGTASATEAGIVTTGTQTFAGAKTFSGTIAVNGGTISSSASTLVINAGGNVDVQDTLNADNITTDTGGVSIAASQSYTGAGAVTVSSAAASSLTINSGTTGGINLGDDASAETINLGTGAAAKTLTLGSTNSTSSTLIQSGSGDITLQSRGSGTTGFVNIGEASTTPDILVVGTKTTSGNPTGADGGVYYNSNAGKFYIQESGSWKEVCNKTDAACGAGSGSAWSALSNPAGNLSLSMAEFTTSFNWDTASTAAAKDYLSLSVTNDATTDATTQRLLVLTNNDTAGAGNTERLLVLDNADTDSAVTSGIQITSAAGAITNAIDVSDSDIVNALVAGANDLSGTNWSITGSSGAASFVGVNSGSGLIQGSGGLTISSGTITLSGFSSNGGPLYTNGSGVVAQTTAGTSTQILHGGTTPSFSQIVNADITNATIDLTTKVTGILPSANGGTGVANSNTITLGGNISTANSLTTSGNFALTLTQTGTTNVTLPTSGTLYGTATGSITSSQLLTSLSDETGTGIAVFGTNPTFSSSATFSGLSASSAVYTNGSSALTTTAPTSGTIGYWSRSGTTLQPSTAGDAVTTSGNISTTSSGTITSAALLTASNGLTLTTGALNLTGTSGSIALTGFGTTSITSTTTTGNINTLADTSFAPAASATANLLNLTFTNTAVNTSGTSIGTGINIAPTINTVGSGGTQETYGIRIQAAAGTVGAGTQNIYGMRIGNQGRTNAENSYGIYLDGPSASSTKNSGIYISTSNGGSTRTGIEIQDIWTGEIGVDIGSTAITTDAAFTGKYLKVGGATRTAAAGTQTDTGNYLFVSRVNTVSAGTLNQNGDLAVLQSTCSGTCNDAGKILQLTQSYSSASGDVVAISNSGTGKDISGTSNTWNISKAGAAVFVGVNSGSGALQGTGGLTLTGATDINVNTNSATNINTGTSNTLVSIGGGSGTFALNTTNIDISSAGAITGATSITSSGAITFSAFSTNNGLLYTNGSGTLAQTAAGTTGQCLVGTTGSAPSWSTCSGLVTLQSAYNATSGNTITTTDARNISITLANTSTDQTFEITQAGTALAFRVNDDGTFSDSSPFVITDIGRVGIGIAAPADKLEVQGGKIALYSNGDGLYLTDGDTTASESGLYSFNGDQQIATFNPSVGYYYGSGAIQVSTSNTIDIGRASGSTINVGGGDASGFQSTGNSTVLGDWDGSNNGTTLVVDDSGEQVTVNKNFEVDGTLIFGAGGGATSLGYINRPFGSLYIGNAGTNNFQITGTATATRTITIPDASGTICLTGGTCVASAVRLNQITAANNTNSIDNTTQAQTWDWSTLSTQNALTLSSSGTGLTSGSVLKVSSATTGAISNGALQVAGSGNYSGTGGLLNVLATASTAGTLVNLTNNTASFTGVGLSGSFSGVTSGQAMSLTAGGATSLTSGNALLVTGPTGAAALSGSAGGVVNLTAAGLYTSSNNAGLLNLNAGTATGPVQVITANGLTTGTGLLIPHTTSVIASGGSLLRLTSSSADTSTTTGTLLDLQSSGSTAGTIALFTNNTASFTGITQSIVANGITTGHGLSISSSGTITTTGDLLSVTANSATTSTGVVRLSATALTSGFLEASTLGTALTTGGYLNLTGASYNPGNGNTGKLINIAFTDNNTTASATSSVIGISISPTITAGASSSVESTYGIYIQDAAGTLASSGAGTQNIYGMRIGNQGRTNAENAYGLYIDGPTLASTKKTGIYIASAGGSGGRTGFEIQDMWSSEIGIDIGSTAVTTDGGFTGKYLKVGGATRTTSGSQTDTGNYLFVSRVNSVSSGTFTQNGDLAVLQSTCSGTCNDAGKILQLTQSYSTASGNVLDISGAGTGNLITADTTNSSANGVSIDVQSSSSSQYALRVTSNNASTTGLYVRADGNVGISDSTPSNVLTVTGAASISSVLQVGQETVAAYSRFGSNSTGHSLSGASSLLLSGDFEVDGSTFFDGTVAFGSTTTFQANDIQDAEVSDTLSVSSAGSVHWDALNNYPAACSAGSAISALADTTNTCTAFNTDTSITLQDAYDATSGNTITTTSARNIAFTFAANTSLVLDAAATDTTQTNGVIDLDVDSSTNSASAIDINFEGTGTTSSATQNGLNLVMVPSNATNARTYNGIKITNPDSGSLANTITGLNVDVTTSNSNDTTYAALFQGGNVGIGTATPTGRLIANPLHVFYDPTGAAACGSNTRVIIGTPGTIGGDTCAPFAINQADPNGFYYGRIGGTTAALEFGMTSGLAAGYFNTKSSIPLYLYTNSTPRMGLSAAGGLSLGGTYYSTDAGANNLIVEGKIGIGDSSPSAALNVARTISANSGTTNNLESIAFTTPADSSGTNTHQGLNISPTIGNATAGTNTANIINIANVSGDAEVSLNAVKVGNLTGTGAAEYALNIGSGWDDVLRVNGSQIINGSGVLQSAGLSGTYSNALTLSSTSNAFTGTIGQSTPLAGSFTTLSSTGSTTLATGSSTTNTFGSGASSINTIGSSTTPGALTLHGATTLDNTFTVSGSNLTTLGGNLTVTGTAWTATPTISGLITATSGLTSNGTLTVSGGQNLTMASGSGQFAQTYTGTTTTASTITASSISTGTALSLVGPTSTGVTTGASSGFFKVASDVGSAGTSGVLGYFAPDFSAGSATTGYGIYINGTDSTSIANINYNSYSNLALTGNAAKTGIGMYSSVTSSSTTADILAALDIATDATGIITTGTRSVYGARLQPSAGAESTGGTTNVYGAYSKVTADVGAGGTVNGYGLYVANGVFDTDGTSTNIGLYVESPTGADNNYAAIFAGGSVGMGVTSSLTGKLHVVGSTTASGATAVAGIFSDLTLTNGTGSGFEYGNRTLVTVNGGTAGTNVGQFIRMTDSTTLDSGQVVRGLEVQAFSGTNVLGTNTGIASYGYTFGIQGTTTAQAAAQAQPAAIFADLDNGTDATTKARGNAIRAYTDNATSADLVYLYQETSAYTGNALLMDIGNAGAGGGSFASGNFINLKNAGTSKLTVSSTGAMTLFAADTDNVTPIYINTEESTVGTVIFAIESDTVGNSQSVDAVKAKFLADGSLYISLPGTQTTHAVCHTGAGKSNADELVDCDPSAGADFAEMYPVESGVEAGDVVSMGTSVVNTYEVNAGGSADWTRVKGQIAKLVKANQSYQTNLIGIVSDNYADFSSTGYNIKLEDNPKPVALVGRVPVKVTTENGVIKAGDFLTSSTTVPGAAMKADKAGAIVGQALGDYSGADIGKVMVFVKATNYSGVAIDKQISGLVFNYTDAVAASQTSKQILESLIAKLPSLNPANLSQINTDVVVAGAEVISPNVTAGALRADTLNTATASGGLKVAATTIFNGGLTVDEVHSINGLLAFRDDVEFFGVPYFTSDTAGFALIKAGARTVDVAFTREYLAQPIVNASFSFEQDVDPSTVTDPAMLEVLKQDSILATQNFLAEGVSYAITNKSKQGFTIVLNKLAASDVKFSWTAFAVRNAATFTSIDNTNQGSVAGSSSGGGGTVIIPPPAGDSPPQDTPPSDPSPAEDPPPIVGPPSPTPPLSDAGTQ